MLKFAATIATLSLFWIAPAQAQSAKAEIDRATFFAGQANKNAEEALFYFKHNRASYACTFLGTALSYTNRAIASLNEARGMTSDPALLRRIGSDLSERRGNRLAILEAGQRCDGGLADYDEDRE